MIQQREIRRRLAGFTKVIRRLDDACAEKVTMAARQANAHGFILALPDGYDTKILEGGSNLSAGQRRRLNLARILAAPAPLWLLDEPKTALDTDAAGRLDAAVTSHRAEGGMVVMSTHGGSLPEGAATLDLAAFPAGMEAAAC